MVGICCFFCGASSCCVIAARGQTTNAAYIPTGRWTSAVESSARISGNASAHVVPFPFARHAGPGRRVSCAGHRRAYRAATSRATNRSFFTRPETRRVHHAGNPQIYGVDLRLVLAHRHRRERRFLLRDLRPDCVPCESPALQIIRAFSGSLEIDEVLVIEEGRAARQTKLIGGEHNSPKNVPPPINHQSMGTNNRTAQCQLDAAACSDWAWLCK